MRSKASVKKKSRENWVMKNISKLKGLDVLVGVPGDSESRSDEEITNAELAFIQEKGVRSKSMRKEMDSSGLPYSKAYAAYIRSHGSPMWRVPPRPFLEPSVDEDKERLGKMIGAGIKAALNGDLNEAERLFELAGQRAENNAKEYINAGDKLLPNAPSTSKAKAKGVEGGAPPPLIDTGDMRNSITHVVRGGK